MNASGRKTAAGRARRRFIHLNKSKSTRTGISHFPQQNIFKDKPKLPTVTSCIYSITWTKTSQSLINREWSGGQVSARRREAPASDRAAAAAMLASPTTVLLYLLMTWLSSLWFPVSTALFLNAHMTVQIFGQIVLGCFGNKVPLNWEVTFWELMRFHHLE